MIGRVLISMVLGLGVVGCGSGLQLTKVDAAHRKPSNVAVFFAVHTRSGEPVPGLEEDDFRIYEDGTLVSPHESQQTIVSQEMAAEHYTILLVDMSGSVTESDDVDLIADAAERFTAELEGHQRVAVYAFDGSKELHPIQPFTQSAGAGTAGLARLRSFRPKDPSTNLYGAVVQAVEELEKAVAKSSVPLTFGTIVVFTDGTDRAARVSYDEMIEAVDEADHDVFAIGVGHEIDEGTLSKVGREGHVHVQDSSAISDAFKEISARIVGHTQSYYLLSYCSPARAGTHEVTVEAVKDDKTGELTYEFDAAGFSPSCNPETPPPFKTKGRSLPPPGRD
jgi:VWFA-related protein